MVFLKKSKKMTNNQQKVFFQKRKKLQGSYIGEIKLTQSKALNALDKEIIVAIKNQLIRWEQDSSVVAIFLHSDSEKAFSAGGDIKSLFYALSAKHTNTSSSSALSALSAEKNTKQSIQQSTCGFFENEYCLDYLLHTYRKPVITWGEGLVMGGGVGLFWASSHLITTPQSKIAMPEINIGFFTDVGSSYFLSRMPYFLGWYIALTGYVLNSTEHRWLLHSIKGWGDGVLAPKAHRSCFCFDNAEKEKLWQLLLSTPFDKAEDISRILNNFKKDKTTTTLQDNWLQKNQSQITSLMQSQNIHTIYQQLHQSTWSDDKGNYYKNQFLKGSPSSLAIICELLKKAKNSSLKEVFCTDLTVALNIVTQADFKEGIRALLIDKTNNPQWNPDSIKDITMQDVKKYFQPQNQNPQFIKLLNR